MAYDVSDRRVRQLFQLLALGVQDGASPDASVEGESGSLPNQEELDELLPLAREHALTSYVAWVLENNGIDHEEFHTARDFVTMFQLRLQIEEQALCDFMDEQGITYIPLKGMVQREDWPAFATRQMADLDILVDPDRAEEAGAFLEKRGFQRYDDDLDTYYHTTYSKDTSTIEIHESLGDRGPSSLWETFTNDAVARSIPAEKGSKRLFTTEDSYLYFIMHGYKHYVSQGLGLRFLMDMWFFTRAHPEATSSPAVREKLEALLMSDFEQDHRELLEALLDRREDPANLPEKQKALLEELLPQIAHPLGTVLRHEEDWEEVAGKGSFAVYRKGLELLRERETWYAFRSPFAYRHPWARPLYLAGLGVGKALRRPALFKKKFGNKDKWKNQ